MSSAPSNVIADELRGAAAVLASAGMVDAFGHVSARDGDEFLINPPRPLRRWASDGAPPVRVSLDEGALSEGAPGEAWIHWAVYRARPDVGAICRAQPDAAQAVGVTQRELVPLHGQGALAGARVPVLDDARLVRTRELGERLAETLGDDSCVLLRGNGAVGVGSRLDLAVARMWALEASARLHLGTASSEPVRLSATEIVYWEGVADELLARIYAYLAREAESP